MPLQKRNLITLLLLIVQNIYCQESTSCETKESCSECIQNLNCIWCIDTLKTGTSHCRSRDVSQHDTGWCNAGDIVDPKSSFEILEDIPLRADDDGNAVQIKPQHVKVSLRKGQEYKLKFQYAQAKDYPVDLYYLMDLSASMESHREKLGRLGEKLAYTMKNITRNFRLGFGSFVDKVALPFASTAPDKLKQPCRLTRPDGTVVYCVPPYSFKNHMSLNDDYREFSREVSKAKVSGNLDAPEGGLDALMQAMVCKDVIGWRSQARHLLVFSTDADYHIAGDGKLAGVVEPNDARCHMVKNEYTDSLKYDYPSVSQINYIAKENNVNLIFAVVKKFDVLNSYKRLSESIENSNAGGLDEKSDNVIQLVLDNYNKIVDSVTLTSNATNDVDIKFTSTCKSPKENGCSDIHVGQIVDFTATIKLLECPKDGTRTKYISIKPEALDEDIIVELETLCDCGCEHPPNKHFIPDSSTCSKNGNLECGICKCHKGYFGKNCECDAATSFTEDDTNCKVKPDDEEVCSNLGICRCGKCQCNKGRNPSELIYGKYCQCDNYSCIKEGGLLCSGRGTCDCGRCVCHSGWNGESCQCPDSNSTCIAPNSDGSVCSGHGACECGKCKCFMDEYRYSGKYCEECPTCPGQRCQELRDCVECQAYNTGIYDKNDCKLKCTPFTTEVIDKVEEDILDENVKICRVPDKSGCTFVFRYTYSENKTLIVQAQKEKICPAPVNVLAWIIGVVVTVILAGLIMLIIWKVVTSIHDRREYAKFVNEQANRKWHNTENPLYRGATSTFNNPVYNRQSRFSFRGK